MASKSRTLYVGMTGDRQRRVDQHKSKRIPGLPARYNITRLVHFESTNNVHGALNRKKQIKGWLRRKHVALIEATNPDWADRSESWFE